MQNLLFTNAFFEEELITNQTLTPLQFLEKHPFYFQLQYLSFLVRNPLETPLLSNAPSKEYLVHLKNLGFDPSFTLFSDFPKVDCRLSSWGPSTSLANWALDNKCSYKTPSLEVVKKVQSKLFSFETFSKLPSSTPIQNIHELIYWWKSVQGPKVLKTLYGSSGRGHFIGSDRDLDKAISFLQKNEKMSPYLIAQPWVERVLDFSSQWTIEADGTYTYLGATVCENSSKGTYQKSIVGPEELLFKEQLDFFKKHLLEAKNGIKHLISLNFFGNVGFDSMVYKHPKTQELELFPIVEINARKTMGWVALRLYQKFSCEGISSLHYQSAKKAPIGLLPTSIGPTNFPKQLIFERKKNEEIPLLF